ncbi:dihydrofolate reductase family protein [Jiangella alkaliphila]|uniref:Dihydrofolate reductase n=1 Tax=Jiangella alkaliphila TaxID=419479 RepID=A0A1H2IYI8_9ACTN|nr:dihydrofolate reductase family protein [Jiangella alkaliphila]SDU49277.1 Dihydrofolate reductase [Jiangella alkaliphila]
MGKIVVIENVSLDGVMQAPGGPDEDTRGGFRHGGWGAPYADEVAMREMSAGMAQGSAGGPLLFGRVTYQNFEGFWPKQTDGNPFTPVLNAATKYVVSTSLTEPLTWENSVLVRDGGELAAVKEREPGDIGVLGSGELVQTLLRDDLVDQFVLSIHPLVLGEGTRLFRDGSQLAAFRLVKSVPTTTGVIIATYDRDR